MCFDFKIICVVLLGNKILIVCWEADIFLGPRTLVRISSYEDPFKIDERLEKVPPNPLGDDTRTEGTGIESVTNLISVDSLFGGIPAFSENLSHIGDKFGNFFLHRASMPTTEQPSDRCTSPAEEAITGWKTQKFMASWKQSHRPDVTLGQIIVDLFASIWLSVRLQCLADFR